MNITSNQRNIQSTQTLGLICLIFRLNPAGPRRWKPQQIQDGNWNNKSIMSHLNKFKLEISSLSSVSQRLPAVGTSWHDMMSWISVWRHFSNASRVSPFEHQQQLNFKHQNKQHGSVCNSSDQASMTH
jgi:hypothetical protein